jgi:uncharacterized protein YukE
MVMLGADPEQLEALADVFHSRSVQLDCTKRDLTTLIHQVLWLGPEADFFQTAWQGQYRGSLQRIADLLESLAETLRRQADEQRTASQADVFILQCTDLDDPVQALKKDGSRQTHTLHRLPDDYPLYRDGVSPYDVRQGNLNNCFFPAAIAAIASTSGGRALLRSMITENSDGTYTVHFPDGEDIRVDRDLYWSGDHAAYGSADGEAWFAILEKAYAEKMGGYDVLDKGGTADTVFTNFGMNGQSEGIGTLDDDALTQLLSDAHNDGRPITASAQLYKVGTGHENSFKYADGGRHAFSISDITVSGGQTYITMRNPWGADTTLTNSFDSSHHAADVVTAQDGVFTMTLDEFRNYFDTVRYVAS